MLAGMAGTAPIVSMITWTKSLLLLENRRLFFFQSVREPWLAGIHDEISVACQTRSWF